MSIVMNNLFGIKFPYNFEAVSRMQSLAGVKWDAITKTWWVPTDRFYDLVDIMKGTFPNIATRLETSPRFQEVRDIIKNKKEAIKKSYLIKADIEISKPDGLDYKNYQYGGISYAYDLWKNKKHGVFIADEMGCIDGEALVDVQKDGSSYITSLWIFYKMWKNSPEGWYIRGFKNNQFVYLPVGAVLDKGKKDVVKVTTKSGCNLICTPDHELFTTGKEWIPAENISGKTVIRHFSFDNYGESEISSVTPYGRKRVYDVVVNDDVHNFVADSFVVHNCGKTIQALGFINKIVPEMNRMPKTLIVCPAALKMNWYREARKWIVKQSTMIIMESGMPEAAIAHHNIVIINYDILNRYIIPLVNVDWDVTIYDESHYVKNASATRSKAANTISKVSDFCILLTGTPILNRPFELWHQLNIIDPDQFKSRTEWKMLYCGGTEKDASNLDTLQELLRSTYMIRRMKNDVLTELPPKIRQAVEISKKGFEKILAAEQPYKKAYLEMETKISELEAKVKLHDANEADYRREIKNIRTGKIGTLGEIARIRHETAMAKLPKVVDFVSDILENKDKVLVFAHHRDVIEGIASAFGKSAVVLYGGMSTREKDNAVNKFMTDPKIKVFVISISAGGVGLTLTATDTVVFAEEDWAPSNMAQCEDRAHRIGQKDTVFVYHLVIEDTIDAYIAKRAVEKTEIIEQSIDIKGGSIDVEA